MTRGDGSTGAGPAATPAEPDRVFTVDTPAGTARVHEWRPAPGTGAFPAEDMHRRGASTGGTLVLGHGAGGRSWSGDLLALTACAGLGWRVCLVEQPWRVAGRKVAAPPPVLDRAWVPTVAAIRSEHPGRPLVVGGRSAGARVACRTATATGADAVLALSFPLSPPARRRSVSDASGGATGGDGEGDVGGDVGGATGTTTARPDRAPELALPVRAGLPLLVVQGSRDPFGGPQEVQEALDRLGPNRLGANTLDPQFDVDRYDVLSRRAQLVAVPGTHSFPARSLPDIVAAVADWLTTLDR